MGAPPERVFFDVAKQSYSTNPAKEIDGFTLLRDTPTMDAYIKGQDILLGVRGTKLSDFADIKADASLPLNLLTRTARYDKDRAFVLRLMREYPMDRYNYYLSGHSLGGAIETQLKREFPRMKYAVEYNPAFQPRDYISPVPGIQRIYTSSDFLYKLGGRFFRGNVVVDPSKDVTGNVVVDGIRGHVLDNFKSGLYSGVTKSGFGIGRLGF
jgi:hypothetical protein